MSFGDSYQKLLQTLGPFTERTSGEAAGCAVATHERDAWPWPLVVLAGALASLARRGSRGKDRA